MASDGKNEGLEGKKLGRYIIEEELGRGGMAIVYRARQESLNRDVAIKVLPFEFSGNPESLGRFNREAEAMASLSHPNIVQVIDKGEEQGVYYFVMEFVAGGSLRDLLEQPEIEFGRLIDLALQICDGLEYAHQKGVVHRDLKPANILYDPISDKLKIADFGIARLVNKDSGLMTLTMTGVGMGTVNYMSPEQKLDAKNVDHRADIYAVGVILYEMMTGQIPLGHFDPPSKANPKIPQEVDEVVLRCLKTLPDQRYASIGELAAALREVRGLTAQVGTIVRAVRAMREFATTTFQRRRGAVVFGIAVVAAGALGWTGWWGWKRIEPPRAPTPAPPAGPLVAGGDATPARAATPPSQVPDAARLAAAEAKRKEAEAAADARKKAVEAVQQAREAMVAAEVLARAPEVALYAPDLAEQARRQADRAQEAYGRDDYEKALGHYGFARSLYAQAVETARRKADDAKAEAAKGEAERLGREREEARQREEAARRAEEEKRRGDAEARRRIRDDVLKVKAEMLAARVTAGPDAAEKAKEIYELAEAERKSGDQALDKGELEEARGHYVLGRSFYERAAAKAEELANREAPRVAAEKAWSGAAAARERAEKADAKELAKEAYDAAADLARQAEEAFKRGGFAEAKDLYGQAAARYDEAKDAADRARAEEARREVECAHVLSWGSYGRDPGQFAYPKGIAVDPSGSVYVSDFKWGKIVKFSADGRYITSFAGAELPADVACDAQGNVYVANQGDNNILKFDSNGSLLGKIGSKGSDPGEFLAPVGVAVDKAGNIYVSELRGQRVQKLARDGRPIKVLGTGTTGWFDRPLLGGLCVDNDGNVWVTDTRTGQVKRFDPEGNYQISTAITFQGPADVAVDARGRVYVTEQKGSRFDLLGPDGSFKKSFGSLGKSDGTFNLIDGIAHWNGFLFVVDTKNFRIQKFQIKG